MDFHHRYDSGCNATETSNMFDNLGGAPSNHGVVPQQAADAQQMGIYARVTF
jgi:hypothetical protein